MGSAGDGREPTIGTVLVSIEDLLMRFFLFATMVVGIIFAAMYEPPKYRPLFQAGEIIWDCDLQSLKTKRGEVIADCVVR